MNAFRLLRLVLWGIVLAACLVVVALNYAVSRSTSSQDVQAIADEADAYTTIRQQLIAPKLLAAAKTTDYSTLVDAELIDSALSDSFSEQQLKKLLRPATESLALWLDSRRPDATFSVDASSQLAEFRSSFTTQLSARYMALPDCTYLNTYEDAQRLVCKSPYVTEEDVREEISQLLTSQEVFAEGKLSSDQLALPANVTTRAKQLPTYINMLYSANIFALCVAALIGLWLLGKHRLAGIVTIGGAGLLAGGLLFGLQTYLQQSVGALVLGDGYQQIARAGASIVTRNLQELVLPLLAVSTGLIVVGSIALYLLHQRRSRATPRVHMDTPARSIDNEET